LNLKIPAGVEAEKFQIRFGIDNAPRPRYLGRANSKEGFEILLANIPPPNLQDNSTHSGAGVDDLVKKLEYPLHHKKKSGKAKSEKAAKARQNTLEGVRKYLGLPILILEAPIALDINLPPPGEQYQSVIFLSIDLEVSETYHDQILEVGISALDTARIGGTPLGEGGKNLFSLMHHHHLRVTEYSYMRNHRFVKGCPENFNFG
jgi:hypothetical protein